MIACIRLRPSGLLLLLIALISGLCAVTARAGTYEVHACDPNFGGGGTPSWTLYADAGLTAAGACAGLQPEGLFAKSLSDGGTNSAFQGAFAIFDAAPGTTVDSIHGDFRVARPNCNWGVGVVASDGDLAGRTIYYLNAGACGVYSVDWLHQDLAVNASRVRLEARCGASSCARGTAAPAEAQARNIRVTIRDDVPPNLTNPRGSLWTNSGWMSGTQDIAFDASDGSGIARAEVVVDGRSTAVDEGGCDFTLAAPCPTRHLARPVATQTLGGDGVHTLTIQASDTAGNPAGLTTTVHIDNTPPPAPASLAVSGGDTWRSINGFHITWLNPDSGGGAPVTAAQYELCPPTGPCVQGSRAGDNLTSIDAIGVPHVGDWTLQLWLRDAAGNESRANASGPIHLRFDDVAPSLAFDPVAPADPTLVSVHALDDLSGIGRGRIEIRREGSSTWQTLPSTVEGDHVVARLNDELLKRGSYELRAWAVDAAGNERSTTDRADGSAAQVRLPLRVQTRIHAGVAAGKKSITPRARVRVRFGKPVKLGGRLVTREGNPIPRAQVLVYSQKRSISAPMTLVASMRSDRQGRFSYRAPSGPSRTVRFRFSGTATIRPSLQDVVIDVRARTTLKPKTARLVNGEYLHLKGALLGEDVPAGGKLIALQVALRGHWHTFATARTDAAGRWRYQYRFDGTHGSQTYRFRAVVPRELGYPYAAGASRIIHVHVRGL